MSISDTGLALLKEYEALVLYPYDDAGPTWPRMRLAHGKPCNGNPTIGYGHVILEGEDLWRDITREEADALLLRDLGRFEIAVDEHVHVEVTQHQRAALVIFSFNCGVEAFRTSTLLRAVNEQRWSDCPAAFALFNKSTENGVKKVNRGLVIRRAKEAALFMTPMPVDDAVDTKQILADVYLSASRMVAELTSRDMARASEAPPEGDA